MQCHKFTRSLPASAPRPPPPPRFLSILAIKKQTQNVWWFCLLGRKIEIGNSFSGTQAAPGSKAWSSWVVKKHPKRRELWVGYRDASGLLRAHRKGGLMPPASGDLVTRSRL